MSARHSGERGPTNSAATFQPVRTHDGPVPSPSDDDGPLCSAPSVALATAVPLLSASSSSSSPPLWAPSSSPELLLTTQSLDLENPPAHSRISPPARSTSPIPRAGSPALSLRTLEEEDEASRTTDHTTTTELMVDATEGEEVETEGATSVRAEYATEAELTQALNNNNRQPSSSSPHVHGASSSPASRARRRVVALADGPQPSPSNHGGSGANGNGSAGGSSTAAAAAAAFLLDEDDGPRDLTDQLFNPVDNLRRRRREWRRSAECSRHCCARVLKSVMPILTWLPVYRPRVDLLPDLLAGAMLAVVCIPQGLAYGALAGLDPIIGLYSCLIPPIVYTLFGCSPSMHIGPFALVSLLVANAVSSVLPQDAPPGYALDVALLFAILAGLALIAMSLLRLGFAVSFLADCVLSAYTCASAFLILTSQWKSFLGLTGMPAGLTLLESYLWIFEHLHRVNGCALLLGLGSVGVLVGLDEINARWKMKIPLPSQLIVVILGTLVTYAAGLDQHYQLKVVGRIPSGLPSIRVPGWGGYNVEVAVIDAHTGAAVTHTRNIQLLTYANLKLFLQPVCTIALISYIISISIAKNFAAKENEKREKAREKAKKREEEEDQQQQQPQQEVAAEGVVDVERAQGAAARASNSVAPPPPLPPASLPPSGVRSTHGAASLHSSQLPPPLEIDANQELLALGLANLLGGFVSAYPAAGSLSRSALVYNAGVRSALHNLFSVLLILLVLLLLTPLLHYLPSAVLAAIVFTALKSLLWQVGEGVRLYRSQRKQDFLMWISTFAATLLFDTQVGIAVGLLVSLLMLLKQTSRPPTATLGRLGHTDLYRNVARFPAARTFRGCLIFRFDAPLHFANKDYFRAELVRHIEKAVAREWKAAQPPPPATTCDEATGANGGAPSRASSSSLTTRVVRAKLSALRSSVKRTASSVHRSAVGLYEQGKRKWKDQGKGRKKHAKSHDLIHTMDEDDQDQEQEHKEQQPSVSPTSDDDDEEEEGEEEAPQHRLHHSDDSIADSHDALVMATAQQAQPSASLSGVDEDGDGVSAWEGGGSRLMPMPSMAMALSSSPPADAAMISISDSPPVPSSHGSHSRPPPVVGVTRADCRIRSVVLDCNSIVDIDDAALKMLAGLPQQLDVALLMCALKAPVRDLLNRTQFFDDAPTGGAPGAPSSGGALARKAHIEKPFVTVHQAVKFLLKRQMHERLQAVATHQWNEEAKEQAEAAAASAVV